MGGSLSLSQGWWGDMAQRQLSPTALGHPCSLHHHQQQPLLMGQLMALEGKAAAEKAGEVSSKLGGSL